jgi:OOP family OmpA-OmpF porin
LNIAGFISGRDRRLARLTIALAGFLIANAAPAQESTEALPPLLDAGAPEGAVSTAFSDRAFDRYTLPTGTYTAAGPHARDVEGRVIWSAFRLDTPDTTTAEVMAGYRARLGELGYEPVFDCATIACGGFDFRFSVLLLPPPAMAIDTADFAQLTASQTDAAGTETFVSILASRLLGAVHIQTVVVAAGVPEVAISAAPAPSAAAQQIVLEQDEELLLDQLNEVGHVPVRGLEFETGGTALSEGSAPALEILARFLSNNPKLVIVIVGHSDNEGTLEANVALSKRRAEAVREALIARGVAAGRLEAHGAGYLSPVATNSTAEGRALNRRVELVLR